MATKSIGLLVGFTLYIVLILLVFVKESAAFVGYHLREVMASNSQVSNSDETMSTRKDTNLKIVAETPPVIDLQLHTLRKPPSEFLSTLSKECEILGVNEFDLYGDFHSETTKSYLRQFESEIAQHFGKEDGVFCLSGGMAQSIVLAINARNQATGRDESVEKPKAFACHPTSHLLLHENDHFHELLGMQAVVLNPTTERCYNPNDLKENGCYGMEPIRLSHVRDMFDSLNGETNNGNAILISPNSEIPAQSVDVSTLILELPHREIGGKLTPWNEVEEIAKLCKIHGMQLHCDGARIFEASGGYGHNSVKQTSEPFESVYISFYKGIGNSIGGAMLLGSTDFCSEARVWLRRFGGNLYSVLPYAVSSFSSFRRNCIKENIVDTNDSDHIFDNLQYTSEVFKQRQTKLAKVLELLHADSTISSVVKFDPFVPQTNMVHGYLEIPYDKCADALNAVEKQIGIRVLSRLRPTGIGCRFEWVMGENNSIIDDEIYVSGWSAFAKTLQIE